MLFAQLEAVPSEAIKNYALITLAVLGGLYYLKEIFGGKKAREVSFEFTPASKADFEAHVVDDERTHENIFSKIGGVERGARNEMKQEVATLRTDLTKAHDAMTQQMTRTFQDMERAIGRVEGRLEND